MQFGRIHGLGLAILGVVLLGLQVAPNKATRGTEAVTPKVQHRTNPAAGILGVISLIASVGVFVMRRKADEPETKYAIK
jgi:hypothetical protein